MYDFEWHALHGQKTRKSAELILSMIREVIPFESVLDLGCGDGTWLDISNRLGSSSNKGIDGPWTNLDQLKIPREDVEIRYLDSEIDLGRRFDLAICLEVAEHLPAQSSETIVRNLVRHSDVVLFGAAIPFQGGFRHLNERWQSYWAERFSSHGYGFFDAVRPQIWDRPDVHYWYKQNILLYVNEDNIDATGRIATYLKDNAVPAYPVDLVHPEKYEAIASYDQIAFKALARKFPTRLGRKLREAFTRRL